MMISKHFEWVASILEEVAPLMEGTNDGQQLTVGNSIVVFGGVQALGQEGHQAPDAKVLLRQYSASRKVRSICLDAIRCAQVRTWKHRCSHHAFFHECKGTGMFRRPFPVSGAIQWVHQISIALNKTPIVIAEAEEPLYVVFAG